LTVGDPNSFGLMSESKLAGGRQNSRRESLSGTEFWSRRKEGAMMSERPYPLIMRLAERGDVQLAFCWVHVRRNFYKLATPGPAPIASEALQRIAALYAIEKDIRGLSAEERCLARQHKSRPLIDALEPWLRTKLGLISQKGKLAEAINYALSRWEGLTRFLDDGRIELDNNTVERSIRPITMRESLCTPWSSVCKHWKRVRVDNATRATFPGHRRSDRLRRQVVGTDLMRCAGNNLHSRKDTGFDKAPYRVVCDA
jgi:transposase